VDKFHNLTAKTHIPLVNPSISSRFAFSVVANLLRGGLAFTTTIIIARVLGPEVYGDYAFLLGSFVATMGLLSMGTSNAFQTFMSQKERGKMFVFSYAGWQLLQILLVLFVIGVILPTQWLDQIWLGHEKGIVLLAVAAVFMQQRAWQTMIQIGESRRLTHRVQRLNISIAAVHFVLVGGFWMGEMLSIRLIFGLILVEHLIFLFVACKVLFIFKLEGEPFDGRSVLREYGTYCTPLIIYSIVGFGCEFADRWMLQNFGGSKQQGLYEIGYRFGALSLLITASLLNIFWKEIAEAKEKGNLELMQKLYRKTSRFLFTLGVVIAGFLVPWSEEIILFLLGPSYVEGSSVLAIMLVLSAFASLAQINGSMLLASGKTKAHFAFGSIFMGLSIPCSYFILASEEAYLPGLQLGSLGLAMKMLLIVVLHVNVVSWWISRDHGWKFDWIYQGVSLGGSLGLGWLSFEVVETLNNVIPTGLFLKGGLTLILYCGFAGVMIWRIPWVAGTSRQEIKNYYFKVIKLRFL
jgi:O-antigen/teichoic acid export membrane protein